MGALICLPVPTTETLQEGKKEGKGKVGHLESCAQWNAAHLKGALITPHLH